MNQVICSPRYKQEMVDAQKSWEQRLSEEKAATQQRIYELEAEQRQKEEVPYLWNLNEDPSLCSKIIHFIQGRIQYASCIPLCMIRHDTIHYTIDFVCTWVIVQTL